MNIEVYHAPEYENDSMAILLRNFHISNEKFNDLLMKNDYLKLKVEKFKNKDISTNGFESFSYKPSLRNVHEKSYLPGTIYTAKVEDTQEILYDEMIPIIKELVKNGSRRAFVNIADNLYTYYESEHVAYDVSCLCSIHYYGNKVSLYFRASDISEELYVDILTIYEFFIRPVYIDDKVNILLNAATCQNIGGINIVFNELLEIF